MTKDLISTSDADDLARRFELARRFYNVLALAGEKAHVFFSWGLRNKVRFVSLFDFDVICGGLPSVVIRDKLENPQSRLGCSELGYITGSHSMLGSLLVSGHYGFSLPFGTVIELFERRKKLRNALSVAAESWMMAFQKAVATREPEGTLLLNSREEPLTKVLLDEFRSFSTTFDDLTMLESIYRNHEEFGNFVLDKADSSVTKAYYQAFSHLEEKRKGKTRNNRCDALNISCVVRMVNDPQIDYEIRPMPLFISETSEVHELARIKHWYDISRFDEQPPVLFNRTVFLQVYLGFLAYHEFSASIAAKEVSLFARQARQLEYKYSRLVDQLSSSKEGMRSFRTDISTLKDCQYRLEAVEVDRAEFDNYWGRIMQRTALAAEHDRIHYINLLENNHFRQSLTDKIKRDIKKGDWECLLEELRSYRHPDFDTSALIKHLWQEGEGGFVVDVEREYSLSFKKNFGRLLCEEFPGTAVNRFEYEKLQAEHEFRFLLHRSNVSFGSILCMDTWRYPGHEAYISILWPHACTKERLWKHIVDMAFQLGYRPSSTEGIRLEEFPVPKKEVPPHQSLKKGIFPLQKSTVSFEICFHRSVLFADLAPQESLEMQIGLAIPMAQAAGLPVDSLAPIIAETSMFAISSQDAHSLLERFLRILPEEAHAST